MRLIQLPSNAVLTASTRNFLVSSLIAPVAFVAIGVVSLVSAQDLSRQSAAQAAFLKENDAAMTKMMNDMAVKPTDDVDRDFVAVMAPHHQGAIDMAQAELRYGHDVQVRRIAQEIIVDQIEQISLMRLALDESVSSPMDPSPQSVSGQVPFNQPDIPVSSHDRVYTADQFSNTVSVVDPSTDRTLGVIRLGDPSPSNFSPLYKGRFSFMGWASRLIITRLSLSQSAPTRSASSIPRRTR